MHRYEFGAKYDVLTLNTEQLFFKIVGTSGEQSIYLKLKYRGQYLGDHGTRYTCYIRYTCPSQFKLKCV